LKCGGGGVGGGGGGGGEDQLDRSVKNEVLH